MRVKFCCGFLEIENWVIFKDMKLWMIYKDGYQRNVIEGMLKYISYDKL